MVATVLQRLALQRCPGSRISVLFAHSFAAPASRAIGTHASGVARPFTTHTGDWSDWNTVVKALREIANAHGLQSAARGEQQTQRLPDTKLLKELGHHELVRAIRKHHGGFVGVAARMGVAPDSDALEIHKQKSSRANRRAKRSMRLAKHNYY